MNPIQTPVHESQSTPPSYQPIRLWAQLSIGYYQDFLETPITLQRLIEVLFKLTSNPKPAHIEVASTKCKMSLQIKSSNSTLETGVMVAAAGAATTHQHHDPTCFQSCLLGSQNPSLEMWTAGLVSL